MWLSHLVESLMSFGASVPGRHSSRRAAGSARPPHHLVVEPLEERLVLRADTAVDVSAGTLTRPHHSTLMSLVLDVAVNLYDSGWIGGTAGKKPKPPANGNGNGNNSGGNSSTPKTTNGGGNLPSLALAPASAAETSTLSNIDAFFQTDAGSL